MTVTKVIHGSRFFASNDEEYEDLSVGEALGRLERFRDTTKVRLKGSLVKDFGFIGPQNGCVRECAVRQKLTLKCVKSNEEFDALLWGHFAEGLADFQLDTNDEVHFYGPLVGNWNERPFVEIGFPLTRDNRNEDIDVSWKIVLVKLFPNDDHELANLDSEQIVRKSPGKVAGKSPKKYVTLSECTSTEKGVRYNLFAVVTDVTRWPKPTRTGKMMSQVYITDQSLQGSQKYQDFQFSMLGNVNSTFFDLNIGSILRIHHMVCQEYGGRMTGRVYDVRSVSVFGDTEIPQHSSKDFQWGPEDLERSEELKKWWVEKVDQKLVKISDLSPDFIESFRCFDLEAYVLLNVNWEEPNTLTFRITDKSQNTMLFMSADMPDIDSQEMTVTCRKHRVSYDIFVNEGVKGLKEYCKPGQKVIFKGVRLVRFKDMKEVFRLILPKGGSVERAASDSDSEGFPIIKSRRKSPRKPFDHFTRESEEIANEYIVNKQDISPERSKSSPLKSPEKSKVPFLVTDLSFTSNAPEEDEELGTSLLRLKSQSSPGKTSLKAKVTGFVPSIDFVQEFPTSVLGVVCKSCCFAGSLYKILGAMEPEDVFVNPLKHLTDFECPNCRQQECHIYFNIEVKVADSSDTEMLNFSGSSLEEFIGISPQKYLQDLEHQANYLSEKLNDMLDQSMEFDIANVEAKFEDGLLCHQIYNIKYA